MKSVCDIKAVLFDRTEEKNEITEKFFQIKSPEFLPFSSEQELATHINILKKQDYESKEVIILKKWRGRFLEICPGSPNVICCNYRIINTCFNCLFNCTYCFLNTYLNTFGIMQFTNINDLLRDIDVFLNKCRQDKVYRIGSGEFTDSLMMDEVTGISEKLIQKMNSRKNIMLELKTKAGNIDHLLNLKDKGNTVLAWSLNSERNIAMYEHGAACLNDRINCAKLAADAGYFVAFHFDPIIIYDGWLSDYKEIFKKLKQNVDPDKVVWVSMGGFRYSPGFKDILREKFPDEELTVQEMFPGIDGKYRYLKKIRIDIYSKMLELIRNFSQKPFVYMCMESTDMWETVFRKNYKSSSALENDFSTYLKNTFFI